MRIQDAQYHIEQANHIIQEYRKEIEALKAERARLDTKMRVVDIAKFLAVSRDTVYNRLNSGKLKSKKMIDVLEYQKTR